MKKLISLLLTLTLLCAFVPSVLAAQNGYIYSIDSVTTQAVSNAGKITVSVTNLTKQTTDDVLVVAAYKDDNQLLAFNTQELSLGSEQSGSFDVNVAVNPDDIHHTKVLIWDSLTNLAPLADDWNSNQTKTTNFAVLLDVTANNKIKLLDESGYSSRYSVASDSIIETALDIKNETSIYGRIVTYTEDVGTGKLTSLKRASENKNLTVSTVDGEYSSSTQSLGNFSLPANTSIVDACIKTGNTENENVTYTAKTQYDLVDGSHYKGYIFREDAIISFVLLISHMQFDESSRFAVVRKDSVPHYTEDDELCELVGVLYNNRETELLFVEGVYDEADLGVGDAFFFETDKDGFVLKVYKVYDASSKALISLEDALGSAASDKLSSSESGWSYNIWNEGKKIMLARAVITEVNSTSISFAGYENIVAGSLDTNLDLDDAPHKDGIVSYELDDSCEAYTYDSGSDEVDESDKYKAESSAQSIKVSRFNNFDKGNDNILNDGIYADADGKRMIDSSTEAIVMIVDGVVVEIYAIEK